MSFVSVLLPKAGELPISIRHSEVWLHGIQSTMYKEESCGANETSRLAGSLLKYVKCQEIWGYIPREILLTSSQETPRAPPAQDPFPGF